MARMGRGIRVRFSHRSWGSEAMVGWRGVGLTRTAIEALQGAPEARLYVQGPPRPRKGQVIELLLARVGGEPVRVYREEGGNWMRWGGGCAGGFAKAGIKVGPRATRQVWLVVP